MEIAVLPIDRERLLADAAVGMPVINLYQVIDNRLQKAVIKTVEYLSTGLTKYLSERGIDRVTTQFRVPCLVAEWSVKNHTFSSNMCWSSLGK